jgi:hypothetical protein
MLGSEIKVDNNNNNNNYNKITAKTKHPSL